VQSGSAGALYVCAVDIHSAKNAISLQWWNYYIWKQLVNKVHDLKLDVQREISTQVLQDMSEMLPNPEISYSCLFKDFTNEVHRITESWNGRGWKGPRWVI